MTEQTNRELVHEDIADSIMEHLDAVTGRALTLTAEVLGLTEEELVLLFDQVDVCDPVYVRALNLFCTNQVNVLSDEVIKALAHIRGIR